MDVLLAAAAAFKLLCRGSWLTRRKAKLSGPSPIRICSIPLESNGDYLCQWMCSSAPRRAGFVEKLEPSRSKSMHTQDGQATAGGLRGCLAGLQKPRLADTIDDQVRLDNEAGG